jgi:hypothetical protein
MANIQEIDATSIQNPIQHAYIIISQQSQRIKFIYKISDINMPWSTIHPHTKIILQVRQWTNLNNITEFNRNKKDTTP